MSIGARLTAFAAAAVLAIGGGYAIGAAVGPIDEPAPRHAPGHRTPPTTVDHGGHLGMER